VIYAHGKRVAFLDLGDLVELWHRWNMKIISTQLGPLDCKIVGTTPAKKLFVLCHGYGAPGDDLVPLAQELIHFCPHLGPDWCFIFPQAPLELATNLYESRAWWHIDIAQFEEAVRTGRVRDLRNDEPDGLASARRQLKACIDAALSMLDLSAEDMVLGGFSQGAMLATDLTLRLDEPPKALVALSGTLLNEGQWSQVAHKRAGLRVFQSHGRQDPILPYQAAQWLKDFLTDNGLQVQFHPFDGMHTIAPQVLMELATMLSQL
jgi:phospholipase/carboxylesterase